MLCLLRALGLVVSLRNAEVIARCMPDFGGRGGGLLSVECWDLPVSVVVEADGRTEVFDFPAGGVGRGREARGGVLGDAVSLLLLADKEEDRSPVANFSSKRKASSSSKAKSEAYPGLGGGGTFAVACSFVRWI